MSVILLCACICLAVLLGYGYCSNFFLKTEYYSFATENPGEHREIRFVMLTDLHGGRFGKDNKRLIARIQAERPDFVCMAGDMTVKDGKGTDSCLALCKELLKICPVYYAPGNHEIRMSCREEYDSRLRGAGVCLLNNSRQRVILYGRELELYGLDIEESLYHKFWQRRELTREQLEAYLGEPGEGAYHILLAHNPEYFRQYADWGADLVLSGHVHGGIAILPLIGGVIDPSLRIFPKYDSGVFREDRTRMVLSRGLGTHHIKLRFFNLPEISVIRLI